MKRLFLFPFVLLVSACASTQPAQDTAELASQQLLRLEMELQTAAKALYARFERQQEFIEQNRNAALEAENFTDQLKREWDVSGNKEASRLYSSLLSTRPEEVSLPSIISADKLTVSTAALKKAIKDLGAVNESLADHSTAEAFLHFGYEVHKDYKTLIETDDE